MPKSNTINDFTGGLSLVDPLTMEDNQLEVAKNVFYNSDRRLQTRRGYTVFGRVVPDAMVLIDDLNDITDWAVAGDATNLTLDTTNEIRGTGCANFDISAYSSGSATLTLTAGATVDISTGKGYIGFWVKFPTGYDTDLTDIKLQLGSDSSNYYEWTLTNPTAATNTFIKLSFTDATATGTPVDTAIDYAKFTFTTVAGYDGYTDFIIDDIRAYSSTTTSPVTSIFGWQHDTTLERYLVAVAGTNMFHYDETSGYWDCIDSGLTEYETATGKTDLRTRFDFCVYKNVLYYVNGHDTLRDWDGKLVTVTGAYEGRYIEYMGDRVYLAGDDATPSTLEYTNSLPADARAPSNSLVIGGDEAGKINLIKQFGGTVLVFKDEKIYSFDVATPSSTEIDTQQGGYANRVAKGVGNGLLYFSERGIDNLVPRGGVTGASALNSESLTSDLRSLIDDINLRTYNGSAGHNIKELTNYYFSFDTGNDDKLDTTLVSSSLVSNSWTQYTYPDVYDYTSYLNSSLNRIHLVSSANGGTIYRMENGFNDNGNNIEVEIKTKEYDFDEFSLYKSFEKLDVIGLMAESASINVEVLIDGEVVGSGIITIANITKNIAVATVSTTPISEEAVGGGDPDNSEIELFPYLARLSLPAVAGRTFQVRLTSEGKSNVWTIDHMKAVYEDMDIEIFDIGKFI